MLNGNRLNRLAINGPNANLRTFVQSKWTVSTDLITNQLPITKIVEARLEVNTDFIPIKNLSFILDDAPAYRTFITFTTPATSTQLEYAV